MVFLLAGLWIGGLVVFVTTGMQNWGALAVAVGFSVLQWLMRPEEKNTFKIALGASGLSITCGRNFLWGAAIEELACVEVVEESKKWGIVLTPRRLVFHKQSGDQYSIGADFFDHGQVLALAEQIEHLAAGAPVTGRSCREMRWNKL